MATTKKVIRRGRVSKAVVEEQDIDAQAEQTKLTGLEEDVKSLTETVNKQDAVISFAHQANAKLGGTLRAINDGLLVELEDLEAQYAAIGARISRVRLRLKAGVVVRVKLQD